MNLQEIGEEEFKTEAARRAKLESDRYAQECADKWREWRKRLDARTLAAVREVLHMDLTKEQFEDLASIFDSYYLNLPRLRRRHVLRSHTGVRVREEPLPTERLTGMTR